MLRLIRKSYRATCAVYLADDLLRGLRFRSGDIETESGTPHAGKAVDSSLQYIDEVFTDYKKYSGVGRFRGRVAEVGPGDNCGVGLRFLADGCESVDLVDRFYSKRSSAHQAEIYRALVARFPEIAPRIADASDDTTFQGLRRRYGPAASAEEFFVGSTGYDFVVSRAVMEHVYDPRVAVRRMAAALRPGGMLLHKVDLRDHGMFSGNFHELKFLEVPDWIYPRMTTHAGRPNRVLAHEYRALLQETLPDHDLLVTRLAGVGDVIPHQRYEEIPAAVRGRAVSYVRSVRHRFAASLRRVADEDLAIAGLFVVARRGSAVP